MADKKGCFFYFPTSNTWGNLDEIVALDYSNSDPNCIYVVWCNSMMIELHKHSEEYTAFVEAMGDRFDFVNKANI